MYDIIYSPDAVKFLDKLEHDDRDRVLARLERARIRPGHFFEKMVGCNTYKLRAGVYRIIADIQKGKLVILVVKVGHRKNVYE